MRRRRCRCQLCLFAGYAQSDAFEFWRSSEEDRCKNQPAMVICSTKDKYKDLVLAAISLQMKASLTINEILIAPDPSNKLERGQC